MKVYFMGIAGTGMASVAGLLHQLGHEISGSDQNVYPPMSTMLEQLGIDVKTPYSSKNISEVNPDKVVIANCLSRGHEEIEFVLDNGIPYTSFPAILNEQILQHRSSVVVSGTHGKTTTSSLITHMLKELGCDPGYLIGGVPLGFSSSFDLGNTSSSDNPFVIEGDEYDTAFFDKGPKFLHYAPKYLVINHIEFDHADIFKDLSAIETQFEHLIALVSDPAKIVANCTVASVVKILERRDVLQKTVAVFPNTPVPQSPPSAGSENIAVYSSVPKSVVLADGTIGGSLRLDFYIAPELMKGPLSSVLGDLTETPKQKRHDQDWKAGNWFAFDVEAQVSGAHNGANIAHAFGVLLTMIARKAIAPRKLSELKTCLASFRGVQRRLNCLNKPPSEGLSESDILVYEDFAHHPTAVNLVVQTLRKAFEEKGRRLVVAMEPRNASQRRNIFTDKYGAALKVADRVHLAPCAVDLRIPEDQRMNTQELAMKIGPHATAHESFGGMLAAMQKEKASGDVVVFLSCGSFNSIQHQFAHSLSCSKENA